MSAGHAADGSRTVATGMVPTSSFLGLIGIALAVIAVAAVGVLVLGVVVQAAEPASTSSIVAGGDPRSEGTGPGLVGSPLLVLGAVIALGIATALVTVVLARMTRRP
jgi:hypothetical protein